MGRNSGSDRDTASRSKYWALRRLATVLRVIFVLYMIWGGIFLVVMVASLLTGRVTSFSSTTVGTIRFGFDIFTAIALYGVAELINLLVDAREDQMYIAEQLYDIDRRLEDIRRKVGEMTERERS